MESNRNLSLLLLALLLFVLSGCKEFSFFGVLGDRIDDTSLIISPATVIVPMNSTVTFTASGGRPPYSFALVAGTGSVDAGTGLYTAPGTAGNAAVRVTDSKGQRSDAAVTVITTVGALAISPPLVTMGPGGSLRFMATGGTPPYTFSLTANGSGTASVDAATGDYTAGVSLGTDQVQVMDSASATRTATVTVSAAVTNVDYTVSATSFPAAGLGGTDIPASAYFTIKNNGSAIGTKPVSWWLYISANTTLGSGDLLLASGSTAGGLAAGATLDVYPTGKWPAESGNRWLFVMLAAADDLGLGNNTSTGSAMTLDPPDVNYTVPLAQITYTAPTPTAPATIIAGTFRVLNAGTSGGAQWVSWLVYASTDQTVDGVDILVAAGSTPPLTAGALSPTIPCGEWPLNYGDYFLLFQVSSPEDINLTDDTTSIGFATPVGIYQAIVQNGNCNNLTFYTDLTGVVLKPSMSVKVRSTGFPAGQMDHLFRLHTGTASTVTASWVLDAGLQAIGIFYYKPPGSPYLDGYWSPTLNTISLTFTIDAPPGYRWIDLYNRWSVDLGPYTLYITAN
jgi:hypothetical protein